MKYSQRTERLSLTSELVAVDGHATCRKQMVFQKVQLSQEMDHLNGDKLEFTGAVVVGEVTTLEHELRDHSVEARVLVGQLSAGGIGLLTSAKSSATLMFSFSGMHVRFLNFRCCT
jgi:hypothetical protein